MRSQGYEVWDLTHPWRPQRWAKGQGQAAQIPCRQDDGVGSGQMKEKTSENFAINIFH